MLITEQQLTLTIFDADRKLVAFTHPANVLNIANIAQIVNAIALILTQGGDMLLQSI